MRSMLLRWPYNAAIVVSFLFAANVFVLACGYQLGRLRDERQQQRDTQIRERAAQLVDELEKELGA